MAEEHSQKSSHEHEPTVVGEGSVEAKDRGLFDFLGKKEEEKPQDQQEVISTTAAEFDHKVQVSEQLEHPKVEQTKVEEEKKPGLLEKLHRSGSSSSSSSSDEEGGEGQKKKKKKDKKGLKDKLKEKIPGEKEEDKHESTEIPVEVVHHEEPTQQPEEKKGFLDKIKEKLPGTHKKPEEVSPTSPPPTPPTVAAEHATPEAAAAAAAAHEGEAKEKKGIFEKIKEKIPGYHPKTEEEKEKEKETASH